MSCRLMVSEKSPEMFFDKIILHQNRKKPKPTWDSNGVALKPNYYIIDLLKKHGYEMLVCEYIPRKWARKAVYGAFRNNWLKKTNGG